MLAFDFGKDGPSDVIRPRIPDVLNELRKKEWGNSVRRERKREKESESINEPAVFIMLRGLWS